MVANRLPQRASTRPQPSITTRSLAAPNENQEKVQTISPTVDSASSIQKATLQRNSPMCLPAKPACSVLPKQK